ncbi:MAG: hypothetical protein PHD48_00020 [Alphaproteobacteria bacterium]|nr:hypothetical protein [Alphaproteobacteria bacterium]
MTVSAKPKTKRKEYEILITQSNVYKHKVVAESAENALKTLRTRVRACNGTKQTPPEAILVFSSWPDPSEDGETWMIRGGDLPKDPTEKTCHAWDAQKVSLKNLPDGVTDSMLFGDTD